MVCARKILLVNTKRLPRPNNFNVHPKRGEYSTKVKMEGSVLKFKPFHSSSKENSTFTYQLNNFGALVNKCVCASSGLKGPLRHPDASLPQKIPFSTAYPFITLNLSKKVSVSEPHAWAKRPREQLISRFWWYSFGWSLQLPSDTCKVREERDNQPRKLWA